jgi:hypothetical protein
MVQFAKFCSTEPLGTELERLHSLTGPQSSQVLQRSELHACEPVDQATLSETIRSVFTTGVGMGLSHGQARQTMEKFLHGISLANPELYRRISLAPYEQGMPSVTSESGGSRRRRSTASLSGSREWKLAKKELARTLVVHLVQGTFHFFSTRQQVG